MIGSAPPTPPLPAAPAAPPNPPMFGQKAPNQAQKKGANPLGFGSTILGLGSQDQTINRGQKTLLGA